MHSRDSVHICWKGEIWILNQEQKVIKRWRRLRNWIRDFKKGLLRVAIWHRCQSDHYDRFWYTENMSVYRNDRKVPGTQKTWAENIRHTGLSTERAYLDLGNHHCCVSMGGISWCHGASPYQCSPCVVVWDLLIFPVCVPLVQEAKK